MPYSLYTETLSYEEIVELFEKGTYIADIEEGVIYSGKTGDPLALSGTPHGYMRIRLYKSPKMRDFIVANIIWMLGNEMPIPEGFAIHHRNKNVKDSRFRNLFALTHKDHGKLHADEDLVYGADPDDDIPF